MQFMSHYWCASKSTQILNANLVPLSEHTHTQMHGNTFEIKCNSKPKIFFELNS